MSKENLNDIKGKISFEDYRVLEINYKLNTDFTSNEPLPISLDISHNCQIFEDSMSVKMGVVIFKDSEEKGYPFEMKVEIEGMFSFEGDVDGEKFLANALAILYPYIRAIVSSYTSLANIPALILPTINTNQYLKENENK